MEHLYNLVGFLLVFFGCLVIYWLGFWTGRRSAGCSDSDRERDR